MSKIGRPTKYQGQKTIDKAMEYANGGFEALGEVIPTAAGLALCLEVNKTTLYEWAKQHPAFSNTLNILNQRQEVNTINNALLGKYNATIAARVLANHGYTDKAQVDHTSSDKSMSPTEPRVDLSKLDLDTLKKLRDAVTDPAGA